MSVHQQAHFLHEHKETANKYFLLRGVFHDSSPEQRILYLAVSLLILPPSIPLRTLKREASLIAAKYPSWFAAVTHTLCTDQEIKWQGRQ